MKLRFLRLSNFLAFLLILGLFSFFSQCCHHKVSDTILTSISPEPGSGSVVCMISPASSFSACRLRALRSDRRGNITRAPELATSASLIAAVTIAICVLFFLSSSEGIRGLSMGLPCWPLHHPGSFGATPCLGPGRFRLMRSWAGTDLSLDEPCRIHHRSNRGQRQQRKQRGQHAHLGRILTREP